MPPRGRPLLFPVKKLLRLDNETAKALELATQQLPEAESESEGIRQILRDWLTGHGYLPPASEDDDN